MKLKNNILLIAALTNLLILNNCNLDRYSESDLTDPVYWTSHNDFREATNYLYKLSQKDWFLTEYELWRDAWSDNAVLTIPDQISNGTYLPTANFGPWNSDYKFIRAANNIIEKVNASNLKNLNRFKAEATFFRAYAYFDLVQRYGDVPLILHTLDMNSEELFSPRTSREIVIDSIYQDLDFAIEHLPSVKELSSNEFGVLASGAALALKSRVGLYEGTRNKFHNVTGTKYDFDYHLQIARNAALTLMETQEYSLFKNYEINSYAKLFKLDGEGPKNKEAIWVYQHVKIERDFITGNRNYANRLRNGYMGVTRSLVDAYLCTDGLPIDKSPLYNGQINSVSEFENRDPRFNATVVKTGDLYYNHTTPYIPEIRSRSGYLIQKNYDKLEHEEDAHSYIDHMLIRYAEVLLNYAEAIFELDGVISDENLNISINLIRNRVALPPLTNAFITDNGLNMQEEIRRERRVELALEGFRYDDLIRWKTAETELPKAIWGVRLFSAEYPKDAPGLYTMTPDSFIIVEQASNRHFDPSKHYLWPLPLEQLGLNGKLKQNPNW